MGADAEPIGLGGDQAFQQDVGTGGRGDGEFPVFLHRRVALGDMQHTLATLGSKFRPKLVCGRQGAAVYATHDIPAQIVAGGGKLVSVEMSHQFQIAGEMFQYIGQCIPRRVALPDFQAVPRQAGMVGIQINRVGCIELGQGRHWLRPRLGEMGVVG